MLRLDLLGRSMGKHFCLIPLNGINVMTDYDKRSYLISPDSLQLVCESLGLNHDELLFHYSAQTGGYCMLDLYLHHDGKVLGITDECAVVYDNIGQAEGETEADWDSINMCEMCDIETTFSHAPALFLKVQFWSTSKVCDVQKDIAERIRNAKLHNDPAKALRLANEMMAVTAGYKLRLAS
jgi:hypothetical protein